MSSTGSLEHRVVMVTGAAQGIGAATARALVEAGAAVALVDVREEEVNSLADSLGGQALALAADITDSDQLDRAARTMLDRFGSIDAVVANAAIEVLGAVDEMAPYDFQRVIDINLVGTWRTVRATMMAVTERRGYYLIVSSLAAVTHGPFNAAYNASKAGVVALAKTLRLEMAPRGVAVGIAYVTYADTATARRAVEDPRMEEVLSGMPGGGLTPMPVERAADAFVHAIAHRQRRVLFDRSSRLAVNLPELASAMGERMMRRPLATIEQRRSGTSAHRKT